MCIARVCDCPFFREPIPWFGESSLGVQPKVETNMRRNQGGIDSEQASDKLDHLTQRKMSMSIWVKETGWD